MLQLWGSVLQLTPHAHSWLPDGVFFTDEEGRLRFHRLTPPTDEDVHFLLQRIERRVSAAVAEYEELYPDDDELLMARAQYEASQAPPVHHPVHRRRAAVQTPLRLFQRPAPVLGSLRDPCGCCGAALHADLDCHQRDRRKLERLLRYGLRPPFAQKRLSLLPDGRVRLKLRKPFYTGQTDVVFEPTEFLRRLAAAVPRPMQNIRLHPARVPKEPADRR